MTATTSLRDRLLAIADEVDDLHGPGMDGGDARKLGTRIRDAVAGLSTPPAGEWIAVSERLPESCKPVLLCVEVAPSGKRHVIRAMYAAANTLELGDEQEWWQGCTTDENETVYVPAGWYEQNQYDETSWHVSDAVIAWQPLPPSPEPATQEVG